MKIKERLNLNFKKALFIIHNDGDGRGCEILARVYLPNRLNDIEFKVIEASNGDISLKEAINSNLYDLIIMGDCSFKEENTLILVKEYISKGNQLFLIDHHKNAMEYEEYNWAFVSVEEEGIKNSGTELLYQFLNQQIGYNEAPKEFVELIRSYDTWDWFKTKDQRPVDLNVLFFFDKEEFVNDMVENINNSKPVFNEKQSMTLKILNKCNKNYIEKSIENIEIISYEDKKVGIIVANQLQGLIANDVFLKYPELSFIVFIASTKKLSFRSTADRENVFLIAKELGGGGHREASGCDISESLGMYIKENILK